MKNAKEILLPDFLIIPRQVVLDPTLQPLDRMVFGCVYWYTKMRNERCTASNIAIATLLGTKPGSVADALQRLDDGGHIRRIFKDQSRRVRQEIISLVAFGKVTADADTQPDVTANAVSGYGKRRNYVTANAEQNSKSNNKRNKNLASDPLAGEKSPEEKLLDTQTEELIKAFEPFNIQAKKWYGNTTQRKASRELIGTLGYDQAIKVVQAIPRYLEMPYCPQSITTPYELNKNLTKLAAFSKQQSTKSQKYSVISV